jgi:VanZ family protein
VTSRTILRVLAWALLATAITLTVVPPGFRPVTGFPSWLEHFAMFMICGSAFVLAYPASTFVLYALAVPFTASLEFLQLIAPGRHARMNDFLIDALSAIVGIALASFFNRVKKMKASMP